MQFTVTSFGLYSIKTHFMCDYALISLPLCITLYRNIVYIGVQVLHAKCMHKAENWLIGRKLPKAVIMTVFYILF